MRLVAFTRTAHFPKVRISFGYFKIFNLLIKKMNTSKSKKKSREILTFDFSTSTKICNIKISFVLYINLLESLLMMDVKAKTDTGNVLL